MDISSIRILAKELNLHNIANLPHTFFQSELPNAEFLELTLKTEIAERKAKNLIKARKASKLPNESDSKHYSGIMEWQLNELKKLHWVEQMHNLIIIGRCGSGKTALSVALGKECLDRGDKVYYCKMDYLIMILKTKENDLKSRKTYEYIKSCDLLIIDEFMYVIPTSEELTLLYRALTFLSEAQSIVFITNRELSDWVNATAEKHLMQTLLDRITANGQILRP